MPRHHSGEARGFQSWCPCPRLEDLTYKKALNLTCVLVTAHLRCKNAFIYILDRELQRRLVLGIPYERS